VKAREACEICRDVHVDAPFVVGVVAESMGVTPFGRADDRLRTWQVGGELVLEFDVGERVTAR
jgi:hypothetical protein